MIIWGGDNFDNGGNFWNTGGRYNPSDDTWTPTSTGANVPTARAGHATIWSGYKMIVWGGEDAAGYPNTGGLYEPLTDSWVGTSTGANVPLGREYATAIWTGSQMIIWGGGWYSGGWHDVDTGGQYSPTSNSWISTSLGANCPTARSGHTAVWTGTEVIIWGGSYSNTGGRYNHQGDTWAPTSTGVNCPSPREWHTAVWTGTEMIIWGGEDANYSLVNTGGIYFTGIPYEVPATSLFWAGKNTLSWSAASCATGYRVYRGNPSELKNLPTGAAACRSYDGTGTTTGATLTSNPAAGSFFWYLAVGYNSNGEGSAGQSSYGPRMILSTGACP